MRILDLFCGADGCSVGYSRAGFEVVGVDAKAQKHYPLPFVQADALSVLKKLTRGGWIQASDGFWYGLDAFDAIHASPPCPFYSAILNITPEKRKNHPDLAGPVRELLEKTGLRWVIENVPGAPLRNPTILCGSMFRLQTPCGAELRRHRLFETNWEVGLVPQCEHGFGQTLSVCGTGNAVAGKRTITVCGNDYRNYSAEDKSKGRKRTICIAGETLIDRGQRQRRIKARTITVVGTHARDSQVERAKRRTITVTGSTTQRNEKTDYGAEYTRETFRLADAQVAMGIDWMTRKELSQAIPPAYTQFIGERLLSELRF